MFIKPTCQALNDSTTMLQWAYLPCMTGQPVRLRKTDEKLAEQAAAILMIVGQIKNAYFSCACLNKYYNPFRQ